MLKENDSLVQVKICGLTSEADVHILEKYGARIAFATEELKQKFETSMDNNITDAVIVS